MPLKDQLKKKTLENNDYHGKLRSDPSFNVLNGSINKHESNNWDKEIVGTAKTSPKPKPTLTDSDWTQLLGTPSRATTSSATANRGNGVPGIRGLKKDGLKKDGRRKGSVGSNSSLSEIKRNQNNNGVSKSERRGSFVEGNKLNGKASDGEESGFSDSAGRSSNVDDQQSDRKSMEGRELDHKEEVISPVMKQKEKGNEESGGPFDYKKISLVGSLQSVTDNQTPETVLPVRKADGVSDIKKRMDGVRDRLRSTVMRKSNAASRSSTSDDLKRGSSMSDGSFDSDSDSGSTSDSEVERQREERRRRREKILVEKAAAKAAEVIKERENMVARLEGEKQSLEKILEEQVKQQAQEVMFLFLLDFLWLMRVIGIIFLQG